MPVTLRLTELAARKRLLLAQSDLHRSLIGLERARLASHWTGADSFVGRHRWWLLGGALAGGLLLARRTRGLVPWLPTIIGLYRSWRH